MFEEKKRLLAVYVAASFSLLYWHTPAVAKGSMVWTTGPVYETANDQDSAFEIIDGSGEKRRMYDQSYAVMIVEERYSKGWSSPEKEGERSSALLRDALEKRGFHVLQWKNLTGAQLQANLNEVVSNIGYQSDARLFFYYFGMEPRSEHLMIPKVRARSLYPPMRPTQMLTYPAFIEPRYQFPACEGWPGK